MDINELHGLHTALITPFIKGNVDYDALCRLVNRQIQSGINGIVAVGTTGESSTLNYQEYLQVITVIAEEINGRIPLLVGTGSNNTERAVELTRESDALHCVSGMLVVAPYYNNPNQEGLYNHFSAVAKVTKKPIILYSIPGRCRIEISIETCARLRELYSHVCGIKESGGNVLRVAEFLRVLGEDYLIFSGDDSQTLPFMSYGAKGVISVASNLVVKELSQMVRLALSNDFKAACVIAQRLYPLFTSLFIEPNPAPIKFLMRNFGIISSEEVRLPLCLLKKTTRENLLKAYQEVLMFNNEII